MPSAGKPNIAACATNPWGVVEGFDVLIAKGGIAPLGMAWLAEPQVRARPPDYLHQPEIHEMAMRPLALPYGTRVTVRGTPMHPGRRLALAAAPA